MSATPALDAALARAADVARLTVPTTDLANAERLVQWHGRDLRHVTAWRQWLGWDGQRWASDGADAAQRACMSVARRVAAEASEQVKVALDDLAEDPKDSALKEAAAEAKAFFAFACASQDGRRQAAMLKLAASMAELAVSHDELDADPWLISVANGTIDLRSGKLRPHDRRDLITRMAPVKFDAAATCPTWDAFLLRAMGGDIELVGYLQRMVGYSLTGTIREHIVGFHFGGGANGKSTFLTTIQAMLGTYAASAPRGLLFRRAGSEPHPTELASLHNARFVVCSEIDEGAAFDEAKLKDLSGGDVIKCRRMHQDFWEFRPTHKLFLAGNHRPTVRGDDNGIWRRLRLVPWTVTVPEHERDTQLPEKLRAELPGILSWAVRGCLAWQRDGLDEPASVTKATNAYRADSDYLGQWLDAYCKRDHRAKVSRKELRDAYVRWCEDQGAMPVGARKMAEKLKARGVTDGGTVRTEDGPRDAWLGVRLMTPSEIAANQAWRGVA